jgi:predicted GNAT family acetyltransferase
LGIYPPGRDRTEVANYPDGMSTTIADSSEQERYEIRDDGEVAGFVQYEAKPGQIAFIHTEVDDRFEGQGLGSRLAAFALDDARERGLAVLPFCPFVKGYIQRHREYVDLVPEGRRAEFDL